MTAIARIAPTAARAPFDGGVWLRRASPALGVLGLLAIWQFGGWLIASDDDLSAFADFAPGPTLAALIDLIRTGDVWAAAGPSLMRVGEGMLWAVAIGAVLGVAVGRSVWFRDATYLPFQFLRMVSPLSWMPIAVMAFATWDGAIVFLVAAAAVWPVTFATANGLRKIDPAWFKVARNLGARGWRMLVAIILPAVAQDLLTGVRLALGVAWIVLVPAEYLGVTSGLGYAINDARDTLEYDRLAALVVVIGAIGFLLDAALLALIKRFAWTRS